MHTLQKKPGKMESMIECLIGKTLLGLKKLKARKARRGGRAEQSLEGLKKRGEINATDASTATSTKNSVGRKNENP